MVPGSFSTAAPSLKTPPFGFFILSRCRMSPANCKFHETELAFGFPKTCFDRVCLYDAKVCLCHLFGAKVCQILIPLYRALQTSPRLRSAFSSSLIVRLKTSSILSIAISLASIFSGAVHLQLYCQVTQSGTRNYHCNHNC